MSTILAIATTVVSAVLEFVLQSVIRENIRLKKEKDEFSYVTPDKIVVSGVIDEIISEKEIKDVPMQKIKK